MPELGYKSWLGIAKESEWGTAVTATAFLEYASENLSKSQDAKIIEAIGGTGRNPLKRYLHGVTVQGTIECPLNIFEDGVAQIINNAVGGTITSSGDATNGYVHALTQGEMESGTTSLTFTKRIGGATDQFRFAGCRVNSLTIKGEVGTPEIMLSAEIIGKDGTTTTDSVTVAISANDPLLWSGVTYEEADTTTSFDLSTTAKTIQSFEFTYSNNLQSGDEARALGSDTLDVLPVSRATASLKVSQRYDTSTAYGYALAETQKSVRLVLDSGITIGTAGTTGALVIQLPKAEMEFEGTVPETGDPNIITQELMWTPLQPTTTQNYIDAEYYNNTASY